MNTRIELKKTFEAYAAGEIDKKGLPCYPLDRKDLSYANLKGIDLHGRRLKEVSFRLADLSNANLRGAYLYGACLRETNLRGANLQGANLEFADLRYADLSEVNLEGAKLNNTDLSRACLYKANLKGSGLYRANLSHASLFEANLKECDLIGANLINACLKSAELDLDKVNSITTYGITNCPQGTLVGYKGLNQEVWELEIPKEAKRSKATSAKCRAEFVKVIRCITNPELTYFEHNVYSGTTVYKVGEITHADSWDDNRWNECSNGIHFFMQLEEAVMWNQYINNKEIK